VRILGIDPGSRVTGYGLIEDNGRGAFTSLCHGEICLSAGLPLPQRLLALSEGLEEVVEEYAPDVMSIESIFFAKNAKSSIVLGQARAVPLLLAASKAIEVFEYAPRMVKLAVTGYGAASKAQVQTMILSLLKITDTPGADASDALAIALCHSLRNSRGLQVKGGRKSSKSWRSISIAEPSKG